MATRPLLGINKPTPRHAGTLEELLPGDISALMDDPKFRRVMLTIFKLAGMYVGSFHSEAGFLHYSEGRRSLGLDILRTLENSSDDAQIRILQEGLTLKEQTHDKRNYDRDRNRELGNDTGRPGDRDDDDGDPEFLDYGADPANAGA